MVTAVERYISRGTTWAYFVGRSLFVTIICTCACAYLVAKMHSFEWAVLGLSALSGVKALTPE